LFCTNSAAFLIYERRIKIDSRVPLYRIKRHPNALEDISVLQSSKNTEVEIRLHIQCSTLAIIEFDLQDIVVSGGNLRNCRIHSLHLIEVVGS